MIYAGLDWSLTCPAICVYDSRKGKFEYSNVEFFYLTDKKSMVGDFDNVHGFKMPIYESEQERHSLIAKWGTTILKHYKVDKAYLEGYSMGSKGMVFNIAENIGCLKQMMWAMNLPFETPAPTAIKKAFSGKGNASKEFMVETFENETGVSFQTLLGTRSKTVAPINDLVDSFAIVKTGLMQREGINV